jgi:Transglutaminase-like superfamily/Domain of Unknown Function with PDB structure (DUF3857)
MHAQVNATLPVYNEKTAAVLLYSETILSVQPNGKIKRLDRRAFKILRPDGEKRGIVGAVFGVDSRITALRGWCIPVQGKDYEVKQADAVQTAVGVEGGELASDVRILALQIPAATPGNIVGYELEQEQLPYLLLDDWNIQDTIPVHEARYTLQLPAGWNYRAVWLNHAEVAPTLAAPGRWEWIVSDVRPVRLEQGMPPWRGVAAMMVVALSPPDPKTPGIQSWADVGTWYSNLTRGRLDPTPELQRTVTELTASVPTPLEKIRALANFVQTDIRYVAIELGIGGYQPHAAADVLRHRYGDCKDKATLLSAMLREIGVASYYVIINAQRGSITTATPPNIEFNHAILAIALPDGVDSAPLPARMHHARLGELLFFDPTDYLTPFGSLRGALQANVGMLVTPDGGELVQLPQLPTTSSGIQRTAKLTLDADGTLHGEVHEIRVGDQASQQRFILRSSTDETDRIKPIEALLAVSLPSFQIVKASIGNLRVADKPFEWNYSFEAAHYAKVGGDLLLLHPRVMGTHSSAFLETRESRVHAVEFDGPEKDTDVFEIEAPPGYSLDELPPPVNLDRAYATYQSKTEWQGRTVRYSRTFEIKEVSVAAADAEDLKEFFRAIDTDERSTAVLKRTTP